MSDEIQHPNGRKPDSRWSIYIVVGVVAAVTSVLIYASAQFLYQLTASKSTVQAVLDNPVRAAEDKPLGPEGNLLKKTSESFRMVAKKVGPAVVNIKATKGGVKAQQKPRPMGRRRNPFPEGPGQGGGEEDGSRDPFFDFFERFGHPFPFMDQGPQTSLGSGVLIDKKGIVVTNNHVVDGANEILVNLNGEKTEFKAKVIGTDAKTDLAVLRVEGGGKEFPSAEWADSDAVEVGDWAIAIGSPFALGQSVTLGIVSAKGGRNSSLTGVEFGGDLIQTDAAINPGNSGGPLCDLEGRVMGINTAIYTRSGGYMGIGFAIPANLAREVANKLITDGKIVRGWLGVYIEPLNPELAKELGVKEGVGVREVIENSPASEAGLKAGDVVLEVDGKLVKEPTALQKTIGGYKPGQIVKIKVASYADKKNRTISVKVGKLPDAETAAPKAEKRDDDQPDKLGLLVTPTPAKDGVVVENVLPGSLAEQSGLEAGDTIVRINRKVVDSAATYKKQVASARRLFLEVKRKGRTLFIQLTLPE